MLKCVLPLVAAVLLLGGCSSSSDSDTTSAPTPAASVAPAPASAAAPATAGSAPAPAASASQPAVAATAQAPQAAGSASARAAAEPDAAAVAAAREQAAKDFVESDKWVEGKNYFRIDPPQPKVTDTDRVEVTEVFSFGCPACNHAHTTIDKMRDSLPAYATMAYLPAAFRPDENWVVYQRAWYAAKALGVARKSYDALFDATWKTGETASYDLKTGRLLPQSKWIGIQQIADFYHAKFDVPVQDFLDVADSFAVNTQMKRADELVKSYGIAGTPSIVVDGKYRFDFGSAGGYTQGIELADYLAARVAAGK